MTTILSIIGGVYVTKTVFSLGVKVGELKESRRQMKFEKMKKQFIKRNKNLEEVYTA